MPYRHKYGSKSTLCSRCKLQPKVGKAYCRACARAYGRIREQLRRGNVAMLPRALDALVFGDLASLLLDFSWLETPLGTRPPIEFEGVIDHPRAPLTAHEISRRMFTRDVCTRCKRAPKHYTKTGAKTPFCPQCRNEYAAEKRLRPPRNLMCPRCHQRLRHVNARGYEALCRPCAKREEARALRQRNVVAMDTRWSAEVRSARTLACIDQARRNPA